jgi:glycosyltransferase involved in cell wall biosynthesis
MRKTILGLGKYFMHKVLNILPDSRISGPIIRVSQTASKLKKNGYHTILILPPVPKNTRDYLNRNLLESETINFTKAPKPNDFLAIFKWILFLPRDVWRFSELYIKHKPDIVHINSAFFIAPAIASKILRIPIVWHINDTMSGIILSKILGIICKFIATKVVVASYSVASHYQIDRNNVSVLYPPVDYLRYHKNSKSKWGAVVKVSLIANWSHVKGLDIFVKAASEVLKKYQNVEFHIAGSLLETQQEYSKDIKALIRQLGLKEKLIIHGHIDSDSLPSFLSSMDIHVLSSKSEACPISVLEGMAASLPIVATNVGGVEECLLYDKDKPAGIIVPVGDVTKLANAIQKLIFNDDYAQSLGLNGRMLAMSQFSLDVCTERHQEIYFSLLRQDY